ncbi:MULTISPECIES: peptidylprolyl isomerase [Psychrobacillus]|uniref:Foldase protein PrsA n=1 Tax=Psychrobacillus faecigallinarum TaxID=2762235 RepID=A0ABR8RCU4_9BACI|nr:MULTISPECIES: peptidylprolyl isomerase [Psychrobacillus]MBD7945550.1 peptidylprolyl isomerase [Psychrobacillus faecigallinarum]QEY22306.1 foldase [Psychrobacillus sp. AK 1817]QGM29193.1 foldase [Bacillus sp. N3536]
MKKTVLSLTLAASVLALGACSNDSADSSEVIATSKVGDITQNDLYEEMKASIGEQAFQLLMIEKVLDSKYDVTDKQVDAQLKADKEQLGENFETLLAQQGYTEESYKKYLRLNLLQEAAMIEDVKVSEDEIKAEYENTKNEVNARHVLVEDEETAKKVKAELDSGKEFAEVAKAYSTEPAAQESGGELGWFGKGAMDAEFEKAAFALEPNVISEPVKSSFGYHIIEVTDKREVKESYEDKKAEIEKNLKLEKADQSALLPKIAKLLKDAKIDIKDKDLEAALDEFLNAGEAADTTDESKTKDDASTEKSEK